jgi:hypothetical protein
MHLTTILTPLLALTSFATAAPSVLPYTIVLTFQTSTGMAPIKTHSDLSIQVNKLTLLGVGGDTGGIRASAISITSATPDLDVNTIECRAYQDADGVVPGSAPFTVKNPALLSTQIVNESAVLCYVVEV